MKQNRIKLSKDMVKMIINAIQFSDRSNPIALYSEIPHSMFSLNFGISRIISSINSNMANKAMTMLAHRVLLHIKTPPIIQRIPYMVSESYLVTGNRYTVPYKMASIEINLGLKILGNFIKIS